MATLDRNRNDISQFTNDKFYTDLFIISSKEYGFHIKCDRFEFGANSLCCCFQSTSPTRVNGFSLRTSSQSPLVYFSLNGSQNEMRHPAGEHGALTRNESVPPMYSHLEPVHPGGGCLSVLVSLGNHFKRLM